MELKNLAYDIMLKDIETKWEMNKDIEDQKEFALAVQNCPAKSILFSLRKKKSSIGELIDRMNDNYKYNLLKSYTKEE